MSLYTENTQGMEEKVIEELLTPQNNFEANRLDTMKIHSMEIIISF